MFRCVPFVRPLFVALLFTALLGTPPLQAEAPPPLKLAILTSLTGAQGAADEDGRMMVDSVRLAVEEANADPSAHRARGPR